MKEIIYQDNGTYYDWAHRTNVEVGFLLQSLIGYGLVPVALCGCRHHARDVR